MRTADESLSLSLIVPSLATLSSLSSYAFLPLHSILCVAVVPVGYDISTSRCGLIKLRAFLCVCLLLPSRGWVVVLFACVTLSLWSALRCVCACLCPPFPLPLSFILSLDWSCSAARCEVSPAELELARSAPGPSSWLMVVVLHRKSAQGPLAYDLW